MRAATSGADRYRDPLPAIDWDAVDHECWWLPPAALSLSGVPEFEALPMVQRRSVSHFEYLHLLQTGLWLEALFVERVAQLAWRTPDLNLKGALLREIREEAGHSLMFVELIRRSGIEPAAPGVAMRVNRAFARTVAPGSALFWGLTVIGEELPNRFLRELQAGIEDVTMSRVVLSMAHLHSSDEEEHAEFARRQCTRTLAGAAPWRRAALSIALAAWLRAFERHLFYPPASLYTRAGLTPGAAWRARALASRDRRSLAERMREPTTTYLRRVGWTLPRTGQK
ncbi:MAG: diiron oxygenase [Casimicrobiaceae bacterium]